jgi:type II secretory pathway pseudopilin PulG
LPRRNVEPSGTSSSAECRCAGEWQEYKSTELVWVGTAVASEFAVIFHNCHRARRRAASGFTLVEAVVATTLIGIGVATTLGALTKFNAIAATSRNATGASAVMMNQVDLFQSMSPFNPQKTASGVDPCYGATPPVQVPKDYCNTPPTYDMTVGTHVLGYKDPSSGVVIDPCSRPAGDQDTWPVYREPARWKYADAGARTSASGFVASDIGQLAYQSSDQSFWRLQTTAPTWLQDTTGGIIVKGTMTCTVTDISSTAMPHTYKAVFTIGYQYLGRGPISNTTYKPCGTSAATTRSEYQLSTTVIRTSDI